MRDKILFQASRDSSGSIVTYALSCGGVQREAGVTQASVTSRVVLASLTAW